MFLIGANPDLPTQPRSLQSTGAQMQALGSSTITGAPLQTVDYTAGSLLATSGSTTIAVTAGIGTVTLPSGTVVTAIAVTGSASYRPAVDASNPQPGEFVQVGVTVTVVLRSGDSPLSVTYFGLLQQYPGVLPTNEISGPFPDLYSHFLGRDWELVDEIKYSLSFEGHPTAEFTFITFASNENDVRSIFYNRAPITLYNRGYEVNDCAIDQLSTDLYPEGRIIVSVQLTGRHEYLMNEPFFERAFNSRGWDSTTVAKQAQKVGLTVQGNEMPVSITPDTAYSATKTVDDYLNEYKRLAQKPDGSWGGGFVYLSNPNAIELRSFGQTQEHFLSDADLLDGGGFNEGFKVTYPGKLIRWQGVQLVEEYRKAVLQFNAKEPDSVLPREFVIPKEDPSVPYPVDDLKSVAQAWDNGGKTKSQETIKKVGKTTIESHKVTYGYAFAAVDVYSVVNISGQGKQTVYTSGVNPAVYWRLVEETTTTWERDQYGYLQKISERGSKLTRLKQESAQSPETLALMLTRDGTTGTNYDDLTKQIAAYQFNLVAPNEKNTEYELGFFASYFLDTPNSPGEPPAKFCLREHTYENTLYSAPDPESTRDNPLPPIVTGKVFDQDISVTITCQVKGQECYEKTTITQNTEGTNLKNTLKTSTTETIEGRPPVHELASDAISLVSSRNPSKLVANPNLKYLLLVQGSTYTSLIDRGSKSYTTRYVEDARAAAELDLAIINSQRSASASIQVRYNRTYQEGDSIWVKGKKYVIFGISWGEKFSQGMMTCDAMSLTIGRYLAIPVVIQTVPAYF